MKAVVWLLWNVGAIAQSLQLEPTFNAGMRLRCGAQTILIDSLFAHHPSYQSPNAAEREAITGTRGAVLALATHAHRDHWDEAVVARLLERNPEAQFWGTGQSAGALALRFPRQVKVMPAAGGGTWQGARLRFAPLPHSGSTNREVENSGLLVDFCGRRVFHAGDADLGTANFDGFRAVDVALVPFWYLLDPQGDRVLRDILQATEVWAIHGDPQDRSWVRRVRERYPNVRIPAYFERR